MTNNRKAQSDGAMVRLVDLLGQELGLTQPETVGLLGLADSAELESLRDKPSSAVPIEMIERLAILLDIHYALNVLLPAEGRPATWLRTPNKAPLFAGAAALDVMGQGLAGMRKVRSYLQAQLYGP